MSKKTREFYERTESLEKVLGEHDDFCKSLTKIVQEMAKLKIVANIDDLLKIGSYAIIPHSGGVQEFVNWIRPQYQEVARISLKSVDLPQVIKDRTLEETVKHDISPLVEAYKEYVRIRTEIQSEWVKVKHCKLENGVVVLDEKAKDEIINSHRVYLESDSQKKKSELLDNAIDALNALSEYMKSNGENDKVIPVLINWDEHGNHFVNVSNF